MRSLNGHHQILMAGGEVMKFLLHMSILNILLTMRGDIKVEIVTPFL